MTIADDAVPEVADPAGYPVEWEFDGLLRNGEAVVVRPIRPADAPALIGCAGPVSPGTHQHVLLDGPALSRQAAAQFSEVDYDARMAFVALVSDEMVGLASYDRPDARAPAAEASFIVAGHRRGHGVTTLLFESLAEYARTRGILCFTAEVRAQNTAMLELFAATGLRCTRRDGPATVRVEIDLRPAAAYRSSCDQRGGMGGGAPGDGAGRGRPAADGGVPFVLRSAGGDGGGRQRRGDPAAAVDRGCRSGTAPGNVGHQVVRALLAGDFSGTVYPVNPAARAVCGVPAFPALLPRRCHDRPAAGSSICRPAARAWRRRGHGRLASVRAAA